MNFELTAEQLQVKESVREFAEAEISPHVLEWDETQHFPVELLPKLAELGLMGVIFPEKYGGAGMGYVEYSTIIEELSRVDGSVGISVAAHSRGFQRCDATERDINEPDGCGGSAGQRLR